MKAISLWQPWATLFELPGDVSAEVKRRLMAAV